MEELISSIRLHFFVYGNTYRLLKNLNNITKVFLNAPCNLFWLVDVTQLLDTWRDTCYNQDMVVELHCQTILPLGQKRTTEKRN
jgi:hypothetical protein